MGKGGKEGDPALIAASIERKHGCMLGVADGDENAHTARGRPPGRGIRGREGHGAGTWTEIECQYIGSPAQVVCHGPPALTHPP